MADSDKRPDQQLPVPPVEAWSFNQPVLLRKTRRNSSALVWTLVGSTAAVALWAIIAPLPETIAVSGKLQPISSVREIEAPVPGVVATVLVKDGQQVAAGAPLIRFDQREAEAKLQAASAIRERLANENAIYRSILGEIPATGLTVNQRLQLETKRQQVQGQNRAAREDLARSRAKLGGLRQSLNTAINIAERYRSLSGSGAASQLQLLEAQAKVDDLRSQVDTEQREVARLQAQAQVTITGNESDLRGKIEANLRQIAELDQQISDARVLLSNIELRAPSAGLVFDVSVGRGSVVEGKGPKPLLKIIPQDRLQAKVYIPNDAIGFIRAGQRADISLASFNASDYGRLPATVLRVGSDALTPEEQTRVLGTDANGLYFPAVLQLQSQRLQLGATSVSLQSGMSLTADIHLRDRRFISVLAGRLENQRRALERMR
jgi:hemolysin D